MEDGAVHPRKKRKKPRPTSKRTATRAAIIWNNTNATDAQLSLAGKQLRARRTALMTQEERSALASKGATAYWATMSEKERHIELKRRAAVRKRRRVEARKKRIREGGQP